MTDETKSARLDTYEKVRAWGVENHPTCCWNGCCLADNEDFWKPREAARCTITLSWVSGHLGKNEYYIHQATSDPLKIAYTPSPEYGRADRQVVTTVGRFLTKHYRERFTDLQIRDIVDEHRARYGEPRVHFAFSADAIERVYTTGPSSCMSYSADAFRTPEHPVRVYDGPDTVLACIESTPGKYTARCVVRLDRQPMTFSRVYGDGALLKERLRAFGFVEDPDWSLDGVRLRLVLDRGAPLCPYIDGSGIACNDGEFLVIGSGRLCCQQTNGYAGRVEEDEEDEEGFRCSHCDDWDDGDENRTWEEESICDHCAENYYVRAVCNRRGDMYYVRDNRVIEADGEYYRDDPDVLDAHDIVQLHDGDYTGNSCVYVEDRGEYYREHDACKPRGRREYFCTDDCTEIDGEWIHDDDLAECCGLRFHKDYPPDDVELGEDGEFHNKETA